MSEEKPASNSESASTPPCSDADDIEGVLSGPCFPIFLLQDERLSSIRREWREMVGAYHRAGCGPQSPTNGLLAAAFGTLVLKRRAAIAAEFLYWPDARSRNSNNFMGSPGLSVKGYRSSRVIACKMLSAVLKVILRECRYYCLLCCIDKRTATRVASLLELRCVTCGVFYVEQHLCQQPRFVRLLSIFPYRNYPVRASIPENVFHGSGNIGQLQAGDIQKEMSIFVVASDQTIVGDFGG